MKSHAAYFRYLLTHKWYVFKACFKYGVPVWLGIIHDGSKFLPVEWWAYVEQFYEPDGKFKQLDTISDEYRYAWLHHVRSNKHHWQSWVAVSEGGKLTGLKMPNKYAREMLADWSGAGMAKKSLPDPKDWYLKHKEVMVIHPETQQFIEGLMGL